MPIFQHGKNAFLAIGYDTATTPATATLTSATSLTSIAGATGTLYAQGVPITYGSTASYGVFAGGIPGYGTTAPTASTSLTLAASAIGGSGVSPSVGTTSVPLVPMVNISQYINDIGFPQAIEPAETTSFSAAGVKTYIVGLKGYSLTFAGHWDGTAAGGVDGLAGGIDVIMQSCLAYQSTAGQFINFVYGVADPGNIVSGATAAGTASIKYFGQGVLSKYDVKSSVSGVVTFDAELQVTGPVYRTTL